MQDYRPEHGNPISPGRHPSLELREAQEILKTAKLLGQDSDLRVFHRFDKLRVFCILRLHHRLAQLTEELEEEMSAMDAINKSDRSALEDEKKKLNQLIQYIESTLKDYDNALLAQERIERFRKPEDGFLTAFRRKLATQHTLLDGDFQADSKSNLNTLVATPMEAKSWFHRFIDHHRFLARRFGTESRGEEEKGKDREGRKGIMIYSEQKIRHVDQIFMNVSFCLLLLCPVIVLSLVDSEGAKLSIVVGFLLFSAILMAIGTSSNNSSLAVLAGYGAFLVFFLGRDS